MFRILYKILYPICFILTWPFWILRDLLHHKPYYFKAKFLGPGRMLPKRRGRPRVWLWALSMGEVLAAKNLVPALEEAGAEVVISSTTAIGRETAARIWPSRVVLASPLDFSMSTRRFVDAVAPDLLVLVETDVWPGIMYRLNRRGVPKVLVSARMSPRSFKGYRYIRAFWGQVLRMFDLITTQSEDGRRRLLDLGADPARTLVIGDLKFDREVRESTPEIKAALLAEAGWPEGRWIVAGSTHAGEDEIILGAFNELRQKDPAKYWDLKLLLAPRNKSDFLAVWDLIKRLDLPAGHRGEPAKDDRNKDVFLLDTLGELDRFYDLAEIALVGKSWAGLHKGGGHNPLEPAAKGKPVIFGPLTHNYRWMTKALLDAGGGLMVPDQDALTTALEDLLDNPDNARDMGRRAANFVRVHQGGVRKTMDLLKPFLERARNQ
jgi:3-deoxy-D-manno-octulosonic-acid transferase